MELLSRTERDEWAVVDELYAPLRRFAAVVAPLDLEPDDLLQEALVGVLRSRRLSDLDHPRAYLRKAVLNAAASHNRRMGRRRKALVRLASTESAPRIPNYPSDLSELVELPPRERGALYLHEVEGYRYSEIAQMLGCSEAAAKKAGARGRRRFEKLPEAIREGGLPSLHIAAGPDQSVWVSGNGSLVRITSATGGTP